MKFIEAKKQSKIHRGSYPEVSLGLLSDLPTQHLAIALKGSAITQGMNFDVFEGQIGQIEQLVLVKESSLYETNPDFVFVCKCVMELQKRFYGADNKPKFFEKIASEFEFMARSLLAYKPTATMVFANFPLIDDAVFGSFGTSVQASFKWQLSAINQELISIASNYSNVQLLDLVGLSSYRGLSQCLDLRQYYRSGLVFDLDFLTEVSVCIAKIVRSSRGQAKKCLVLDLDNTIWGGVIGDDGVNGIKIGGLGEGKIFQDIQWWCKQLKERGILLAVCSKNDEKLAVEPFEEHPEMILKMDDFSFFVANWDHKAKNIEAIKNKLNIGFDSIVFVDDNPTERALVREFLPEVTVPDLPEDPSEFLEFLKRENLFEVSSFTEQDTKRTAHFVSEKKRDALKVDFMDEKEFLRQLKMSCVVNELSEANMQRCFQLLSRTNQFNVSGKRYTMEELREICNNQNKIGLVFSLTDKFGEYGITSLMIGSKDVEELSLDSWVMSCRVFNKTLEEVCINAFVQKVETKFKDIVKITTTFVPTSKNMVIKDLFNDLKFNRVRENHYTLDLNKYAPRLHCIEEIVFGY